MSRRISGAVALALALVPALPNRPAHAVPGDDRGGRAAAACLVAAAEAHRLPAAALLILLDVEGGRLGTVTRNRDGSVDIGPMQVNDRWLPRLAGHWRSGQADTYVALRDSFCANVEAGAWILRAAIDESGGDFWEGVGRYHSHATAAKRDYLRQVLRVALHLQARATGGH